MFDIKRETLFSWRQYPVLIQYPKNRHITRTFDQHKEQLQYSRIPQLPPKAGEELAMHFPFSKKQPPVLTRRMKPHNIADVALEYSIGGFWRLWNKRSLNRRFPHFGQELRSE